MSGAERIAAERQRQIGAEGWTLEHDDGHTLGELAVAGACYALLGTRWRDASILGSGLIRDVLWPWYADEWKPADYPDPPYHANIHRDKHIKNLTRAGALIAAEIDRLERASVPAMSSSEAEYNESDSAAASRTATGEDTGQ